MAFCGDERRAQWFLQCEAALLRIKFCKSDARPKHAFLESVSRELKCTAYVAHSQVE